MGKISELLRWKTSVELKDPQSGKVLQTAWVRIIGDHDLQEAYAMARSASAQERKLLRDVNTIEYRDKVLVFSEGSEEECRALIKAAKGASWASESFSIVIRGDAAKMEEIALDPDAPTLEEQERLDAANAKIDKEYQEGIDEYVKQKEIELDTDLATLNLEDLRALAQVEATVMLPLTTFMNELQYQKVWRAVYDDKECKQRSFSSVDEFKETLKAFQEQLVDEYNRLETGLDEIKN